jgi:EmrB/QacA subfamily drug resistance transporter
VRAKIFAEENRKWWTLGSLCFALFMIMLDNTVVNVALPAIKADLGITTSELEWTVAAYALTFASLLLTGGKLGDLFGRRLIFVIGLVIFTLSSLACGLSSGATELIAARAVQGIGAALLMPATLAIIMATFTNVRERSMAIGIWAAAGALALATGPALGGLISQHLHWGWIFLINVPVGVLTFVITMFYVAESRSESAVRQLDLPGLATSALSLFALTYALIQGSESGWTSPRILGAFALAAISAGTFLVIESRSAHPMVDLKMFRSREFSGGSGTMMIWAFGILGIYFFTSLYLQQTLGFSPVEAGLAFVPMALCVAVFAGIAPRIEARAGAHRTVAAGMLLMVVGLVLFARLGLSAHYTSLLPGFMLFGAGAGLMNVPLTNAVMAATPSSVAGVASALLNASREVAGLLGITVIGAILRTAQSASARGGADPVHAFLDGYHTGLLVTIGLMVAGIVVSYLTLRPRGRAVSESEPTVAVAELATVDELEAELMR